MDKLRGLVRLHRMGMERRGIASAQKYRKKLKETALRSGDVDDLPELEELVTAYRTTRPGQSRSVGSSSLALNWPTQAEKRANNRGCEKVAAWTSEYFA